MVRTTSSLKPYVLAVMIDGTANKSYNVKAKNLRTGETVNIDARASKTSGGYEAVLNLAEARSSATADPSGYNNGDIIEIGIFGHGFGTIIHTIDTGVAGGLKESITVTSMTSTTTPGVSI